MRVRRVAASSHATPISLLLDVPARRKQRWLALAFIMVGGLAVYQACVEIGYDTLGYLLLLATTLSYPVLLAFQDASVLGMLRHGRSLDEILTSCTAPEEWIDSVMLYSLSRTWWGTLALTAMVVAVAIWRDPNSMNADNLLQLSGGWLLLALGLNLVASYVFLLCAVCDRIDFDSPLGVGLGLASPLLVGYALLLGGPFTFALLGIAVICFVLSCRQLALEWLRRGDAAPPLQPVGAPALPRPNPYQRPFNQNPIVIRESARLARKMSGGGLLAVAAYQHGIVLLLVGLLWLFLPVLLKPQLANLAFPLLLFFLPMQAAMTVSTAMVEERERRTLESLALTQLTAEEFVEGWASLGWRYRLVEMAFFGLWALSLGWLTGPATMLVAAGYAWLMLACVACSYMGVLASARAHSKAQAGSLAMFRGVVLSAVYAAAYYAGPWWAPLALLPTGAALIWLSRRQALRALKTD